MSGITSRNGHSNGNGRSTLNLAALEGELVPDSQCYQAKLRAAALTSVGADDVAEVVRSIVSKAKAGDVRAQSLLLTQIVGVAQKPSQISVTVECPDTQSAVRAAQALRRKGARDAG